MAQDRKNFAKNYHEYEKSKFDENGAYIHDPLNHYQHQYLIDPSTGLPIVVIPEEAAENKS